MLTIADAEDAFLEGQALFDEWVDEFQMQWFTPLAETQLGMLLESMGEERKAALRERAPGSMAALEGAVQQMIERGGRNA